MKVYVPSRRSTLEMEPTLSVRLLEIFLGFGTRYHVSASKMISWAMRHVRAAMTTVEEC